MYSKDKIKRKGKVVLVAMEAYW